MQSNRAPTGVFRIKPKLVMDSRFPDVMALEIGDKGTFEATVVVEGQELKPDDDQNDLLVTQLSIKDTILLSNTGARL